MPKKLAKIIILIVLFAGITVAIMYRDQFDSAALESWISGAGAAGPFVFMLIYIIGTVFFLPGSVLTLVGGALFGPVLGTFYSLTGATIGAAISFLVARYLISDWVEQKAGGKLKRLKNGVEKEGWRFVAFVRLVPLFPFNLLNYALGLTRIPFTHYVIASYVCMLPGGFAYTYLGYAGREAIAGEESIIEKSLLALALLAVVAFLPRLIAAVRTGPIMIVEHLKQKLDAGENILVLDVRNADEYVGEQGHIAGAINIDIENLDKQLDELSGYEDKKIALVCKTDRRSAKAARMLSQQGYSDVHVVEGGMTAWNNAGYDVE